MRLSALSKFILTTGLSKKSRLPREVFYGYYKKIKNSPKRDDQVDIITKVLERLIDQGLFIGYGIRTAQKWYIKEVKLTAHGHKIAKKLLGEQQRLPLKK